jgi:peptidoglycan/xylan/chitin deacetylase (PgdA/CDA1 family)
MHTLRLLTFCCLLILIVGNRSFLNIALSISAWHPLLTTRISANGGTSLSDPNGLGNRSTSTFGHFFAHSPMLTSRRNISNDKVIMIGFDDAWKSQITYAKPILDKYGFKATFFVVCNYVNSGNVRRMNWQDIATLQKDGMDIESHSMTHTPYLNRLHQNGLDYEIGGSKQCLATHGYNSTIFAYPYDLGSNNPAVVNTVAKYYNIGRSGS